MKCPKCNQNNDEDSIYCKYCGYPIKKQNTITNTKKIIKINYLLSIIFGWIGIPLILISKTQTTFFIGAIGFLLPLNLLNSDDKNIRKHSIIQIIICLIGLLIQITLIYKLFL